MKLKDYAIYEHLLYNKSTDSLRHALNQANGKAKILTLIPADKVIMKQFKPDLSKLLNNVVESYITPSTKTTVNNSDDIILHLMVKMDYKELSKIIPMIKPFLMPSKTKNIENPVNIFSESENSLEVYYIVNLSLRNCYVAILNWLKEDNSDVILFDKLSLKSNTFLKHMSEYNATNLRRLLAKNGKDVSFIQNQLNDIYQKSTGVLDFVNICEPSDFDLLINSIRKIKTVFKQNFGFNTSPFVMGGSLARYFRHNKDIEFFDLKYLLKKLTKEELKVLHDELLISNLKTQSKDAMINTFLDGWDYEIRVINIVA